MVSCEEVSQELRNAKELIQVLLQERDEALLMRDQVLLVSAELERTHHVLIEGRKQSDRLQEAEDSDDRASRASTPDAAPRADDGHALNQLKEDRAANAKGVENDDESFNEKDGCTVKKDGEDSVKGRVRGLEGELREAKRRQVAVEARLKFMRDKMGTVVKVYKAIDRGEGLTRSDAVLAAVKTIDGVCRTLEATPAATPQEDNVGSGDKAACHEVSHRLALGEDHIPRERPSQDHIGPGPNQRKAQGGAHTIGQIVSKFLTTNINTRS